MVSVGNGKNISLCLDRMPFKIVEVSGGYKVKKHQKGRPQYFSTEALSKEAAERQLAALYAAEKKSLTSRL